jgi:hypothetical protein
MRVDFDPELSGYLRLRLPLEAFGQMTAFVIGGIPPARALELLAELEVLESDR